MIRNYQSTGSTSRPGFVLGSEESHALLMQGNIKRAYERIKEAESSFMRCVSKSQQSTLRREQSDMYYIKGMILDRMDDTKNSLNAYEQSYKLNPLNKSTCNNIGKLYLQLQDYDRAKEFFIKALSLDVFLPQPYANLAFLYFETQQFNLCIWICEQAILRKVDSYMHQEYLGVCSAEMNQGYVKSHFHLAEYMKICRKQGNSPSFVSLYYFALACFHLNKFKDAKTHLEKAAKMYPNKCDVFFTFLHAQILNHLDLCEDAEELLLKQVEKNFFFPEHLTETIDAMPQYRSMRNNLFSRSKLISIEMDSSIPFFQDYAAGNNRCSDSETEKLNLAFILSLVYMRAANREIEKTLAQKKPASAAATPNEDANSTNEAMESVQLLHEKAQKMLELAKQIDKENENIVISINEGMLLEMIGKCEASFNVLHETMVLNFEKMNEEAYLSSQNFQEINSILLAVFKLNFLQKQSENMNKINKELNLASAYSYPSQSQQQQFSFSPFQDVSSPTVAGGASHHAQQGTAAAINHSNQNSQWSQLSSSNPCIYTNSNLCQTQSVLGNYTGGGHQNLLSNNTSSSASSLSSSTFQTQSRIRRISTNVLPQARQKLGPSITEFENEISSVKEKVIKQINEQLSKLNKVLLTAKDQKQTFLDQESNMSSICSGNQVSFKQNGNSISSDGLLDSQQPQLFHQQSLNRQSLARSHMAISEIFEVGRLEGQKSDTCLEDEVDQQHDENMNPKNPCGEEDHNGEDYEGEAVDVEKLLCQSESNEKSSKKDVMNIDLETASEKNIDELTNIEDLLEIEQQKDRDSKKAKNLSEAGKANLRNDKNIYDKKFQAFEKFQDEYLKEKDSLYDEIKQLQHSYDQIYSEYREFFKDCLSAFKFIPQCSACASQHSRNEIALTRTSEETKDRDYQCECDRLRYGSQQQQQQFQQSQLQVQPKEMHPSDVAQKDRQHFLFAFKRVIRMTFIQAIQIIDKHYFTKNNITVSSLAEMSLGFIPLLLKFDSEEELDESNSGKSILLDDSAYEKMKMIDNEVLLNKCYFMNSFASSIEELQNIVDALANPVLELLSQQLSLFAQSRRANGEEKCQIFDCTSSKEIMLPLKNIFEISFKLPGEAFAFVVVYELFARLSECRKEREDLKKLQVQKRPKFLFEFVRDRVESHISDFVGIKSTEKPQQQHPSQRQSQVRKSDKKSIEGSSANQRDNPANTGPKFSFGKTKLTEDQQQFLLQQQQQQKKNEELKRSIAEKYLADEVNIDFNDTSKSEKSGAKASTRSSGKNTRSSKNKDKIVPIEKCGICAIF